MKRIWILLLLFALFCFGGCDSTESFGVFFPEETLHQMHLEGLPLPAGANNRLCKQADTLLLSLSDDEYRQYVQQIAQYLQAREDLYFVSYAFDQGLDLWFFPYDVLVPIGKDYDFGASSHIFAFSCDPELTDTLRLQNPVRIEIYRQDYGLFGDFAYNTVLEISTGHSGLFAPCEAGHICD